MSSLDQKRGHYKKYGTKWHSRRLAKGFDDIDSLGFCANPPQSNTPAYDWTSMAHISWGYQPKVSLLIPTMAIDLQGKLLEETFRSLCGLHEWDFGWGLVRDRNAGVECYSSGDGIDNGISKEDERHIELWYETSYSNSDKRRNFLRDVFPYNVLTIGQLEQSVSVVI